MSRKAKYTVMAKIEAVERYLRGEASAAEIAAEMKMGKNGKDQITAWAAIYRENGIEGFHLKEGNGSYTAEEKQQAVEEYLQGKGSLREICRKHHIPSSWTLWHADSRSRRPLKTQFPARKRLNSRPKSVIMGGQKNVGKHCMVICILLFWWICHCSGPA